MISARSVRRLKNVSVTQHRNRKRLLERIISASTQSRRCRARPILRMRHDDSRGAETRASMDRYRHHLSRDQFDQASICAMRSAKKSSLKRKVSQPILASAKQLAENDKFQFQHWALSLIGARPLKEGEGKGADRGSRLSSKYSLPEYFRSDTPGSARSCDMYPESP